MILYHFVFSLLCLRPVRDVELCHGPEDPLPSGGLAVSQWRLYKHWVTDSSETYKPWQNYLSDH